MHCLNVVSFSHSYIYFNFIYVDELMFSDIANTASQNVFWKNGVYCMFFIKVIQRKWCHLRFTQTQKNSTKTMKNEIMWLIPLSMLTRHQSVSLHVRVKLSGVHHWNEISFVFCYHISHILVGKNMSGTILQIIIIQFFMYRYQKPIEKAKRNSLKH